MNINQACTGVNRLMNINQACNGVNRARGDATTETCGLAARVGEQIGRDEATT